MRLKKKLILPEKQGVTMLWMGGIQKDQEKQKTTKVNKKEGDEEILPPAPESSR